ncbi:hypothetical protein HW132_33215 [Brasilonema sp. CT11]|nr:hypothetical protein [Brasilonema sp. CT11]
MSKNTQDNEEKPQNEKGAETVTGKAFIKNIPNPSKSLVGNGINLKTLAIQGLQ